MTIVGAIGPGSDATLGMVGCHPLMEALREEIRRAARLQAAAVVWGPTGVGKELVARALHQVSAERGGPFVPLNVAELATSVIENELFGSVPGGFTDATDRAGLIEAAAGGVLFLDEGGDLDRGVQAKLLRVLDDGEVRRIGGTAAVRVRFRLVLAVQEPPALLLASRRWREDFFYRTAVVPLRVPPLAERRSDIPVLTQAFVGRWYAPGIEPAALECLGRWSWPGNVRELHQTLLRAAFFADAGPIAAPHVQRALALDAACGAALAPALWASPAREGEAAAARILAACLEAGWDIAEAAQMLQMSRATLYRRIRALGLLPRRERRRQALTEGPAT